MSKMWTPILPTLHGDRERRMLTWAQYAKLVGISEATLYNLLSGRRPSRLTELKLQRAWALSPKPAKKGAA